MTYKGTLGNYWRSGVTGAISCKSLDEAINVSGLMDCIERKRKGLYVGRNQHGTWSRPPHQDRQWTRQRFAKVNLRNLRDAWCPKFEGRAPAGYPWRRDWVGKVA